MAWADFSAGVEAYDGGDVITAIKEWQAAAQSGDPRSQTALAGLYADGIGLPQDFEAAARLYRNAAEAGDPVAQLNLAELYQWGRGVPQDKVQAYLWYGLAAAQGRHWAAQQLKGLKAQMTTAETQQAQDLLRNRLSAN